MSDWDRIIRSELRDYYNEFGTRELSRVQIFNATRPALEEQYPGYGNYRERIRQTIDSLESQGDLSQLEDNRYRLEFVTGSDPNESTTSSPSGTQQSSTSNVPADSDLATKSLYELIRSCQMGEAGAIVGGHIDRNDLRQELYIETDEDELLSDFFVDSYQRDGKHLIITGSAGDGKSALLSRAYKQAQEAGQPLNEDHIHMDATAARSKHETYDDTLAAFLADVSTHLHSGSGPRTGLAINLGLAIDFFERKEYREDYPDIWAAIDQTRNKPRYESKDIIVINLSHRATYNTSPDALGAGLLEQLVEKFAFDDPDSPFHHAYTQRTERCPAGDSCPLHYNARQFTDPDIRANVTELIAASGLIQNSYLNPRAVLDIISKMILPDALQVVSGDSNGCPIGKTTQHGRKFDPEVVFWNSVFETLSDPSVSVGFLDPAAQAQKDTDEAILSWSAGNPQLDDLLATTPVVDEHSITTRARTALRKQYLEGNSAVETARDWSWFTEFTGALTYFDPPEDTTPESYKRKASAAVETVTQALKGWSGSGQETSDWVEFVDGVQREYKFLSKWEKPTPNIEASQAQTQEETIPGQLWVVLQPGNTDLEIPVPVTFELYLLMKRISRGYRPNARDLERSEGIRLIHSRLSEFTDKKDTVRITDKSDSDILRLSRDAFETVQIESGASHS